MTFHIAILGFVYAFFALVATIAGALVLAIGLGSWGDVIREILEIIGWGHLARWLGAGFGAALLGSALLCWTTAIGLWARRSWGRWLGLLGSISQVLTFSWPAILGVYGVWVLASPKGKKQFRPRHHR